MTFLAVVSSPLPSSHVVYPVFFLNSATKKNKFIQVSPPVGMVSPGAVPPYTLFRLVTPLQVVFCQLVSKRTSSSSLS